MRERRQGSLLDALKRWESFVNIEPQLDWISPSSGAGAHLAFPTWPAEALVQRTECGAASMQANGWAKRGAVCSRDARLAGARRWARPYAGRVGGASCVGGARAQAFALSEAAASVIRNGRLTMAYRSRKSF